jgi:hypothetical protein
LQLNLEFFNFKLRFIFVLSIKADNNQEQQRAKHQKDLLKKLNEDAKERLLNQKGSVAREK